MALKDLLNGWSLMVDIRHDTTLHYREQTAALLQAAQETLDEGASPYLTLLVVVAPAFRQADELPPEVIELDA